MSYLALQASRNIELFGFLIPVLIAGCVGARLPPLGDRFLPGLNGWGRATLGLVCISALAAAFITMAKTPAPSSMSSRFHRCEPPLHPG